MSTSEYAAAQIRKRKHYDMMSKGATEEAKRAFKRPAYHSKLTAIAAVRIIEQRIERLTEGDKQALEDIAQRCLNGK